MRTPPKSTVSCYGVEDCQELSHARHQSHLPGLARCEQPLVAPLDAGGPARAAPRNGLTEDEIKEVALQSAIYCGVSTANSAFAVAQRVLAKLDDHRR